MDLRCTECDTGYYTAARFPRDLKCSKCDGELVIVPDRDRALIDASEAAAPPAAPTHVALSR